MKTQNWAIIWLTNKKQSIFYWALWRPSFMKAKLKMQKKLFWMFLVARSLGGGGLVKITRM
jgi:hypothetical protein